MFYDSSKNYQIELVFDWDSILKLTNLKLWTLSPAKKVEVSSNKQM